MFTVNALQVASDKIICQMHKCKVLSVLFIICI